MRARAVVGGKEKTNGMAGVEQDGDDGDRVGQQQPERSPVPRR